MSMFSRSSLKYLNNSISNMGFSVETISLSNPKSNIGDDLFYKINLLYFKLVIMTRYDNYFCVGEYGFKCFQNIVINLNLNSPITKKKTFIIIYNNLPSYS